MGKKHHSKKKVSGRNREKKRKQKIQKRLASALGFGSSSSSSSSSSSGDLDPRQNSQIRRGLRRATQRIQAAITDEGGHSSSASTDTWAAKAASIAAALGSVLVAHPPAVKAPPAIKAHHIAWPMGPPMHEIPVNSFEPVPPHMAYTGLFVKAPPLNVPGMMPPPLPHGPPPKAKASQPAPEAPAKASQPDPTEHAGSDSAKAIAALHNSWNLDLRKCNQCQQWTYYRHGICVNKQCPLNQLLSCNIFHYMP